MRLQAIKLAGFKSFVDPTTVAFPSNLCAVVGPNGCGKSNIIDAVRWVMGESSAKNLRGESMSDVIFNGSTTRKPIGQASIELIFDNSEGRLKGEYAGYNEISIKRLVTRDGTSNYFLNNQRCRRKDITDVFLGTGLGPRSYSIIEQGMISQLVEARPEDLRAYLEEAAGISKYKERRRETERRISHTRDNLDRLGDLREELERQIHRLERQAQAAERYTVLKGQERVVAAELDGLRWRVIDEDVRARDREVERLTTEMQARIAEQRRVEAEGVAERAGLTENSDLMNEIQKRFYDHGTEIARLEESLQFQRERGRELNENLTALTQNLEAVKLDLAGDQEKHVRLQEELGSATVRKAEASEHERATADALIAAETNMRDWQARFEAYSASAADPQKRAEVARARIEQLESAIGRLKTRIDQLQVEHDKASDDTSSAELGPARVRLAASQEGVAVATYRVAELSESIEHQRGVNQRESDALGDLKSELQSAQGRLASLEALQQAALGQADENENSWLDTREMRENQRLGAAIRVDAPWELAVETALGSDISAVLVNETGLIARESASAEGVNLTFIRASVTNADPQANNDTSAPLLASFVRGDVAIGSLLAGIYCADDLDDAIRISADLQPGQSVITPGGLWIGPDWVRVRRGAGAEAGVINRQKDIVSLQSLVVDTEEQVFAKTDILNTGVAELKSLEIERDHMAVQLAEKQREAADLRAGLGAQEVKVAQVARELERTSAAIEADRAEMVRDGEVVAASKRELQDALDAMERDNIEGERLQTVRESLTSVLADARRAADAGRGEAHKLALQVQVLESELASNARAMVRLQDQERAIAERHETLVAAITENEAPQAQLQTSLAEQLAARASVEAELVEARRVIESREARIRALEKERHAIEEQVEAVRANLERERLDRETASVRRTTIAEQLARNGFEVDTVLATLGDDANEADWEENLTRTGNRITRLGPINLAAIDEFKENSERKEYLDAQNDDLEKALATLENAIRKIDAETRTRFKETFDLVNRQLQQLFPKLFGGGHAYLEMTGDDLLNTGVGLMARPPGKRNASIAMLSGGEKALTAIALVFSIFSLNPAPFCMLDEVDAPLDDANVARYSDMVKEMSRSVQFIFITHNKIAMEMAEQLMGVTMHEAGVSRLVSVDMEEAVAMAAV